MFVIGLTGGIGSGKSTVAALLAKRGAQVIDCDQLGRLVAEPGGRAYAGIIDRFGSAIVGTNGHIDRAALAAIVFTDPAALADLNALTHPAIDAEILDRLAVLPDDAIVVLDMAVLTESNLGKGIYHDVVVVEADDADRIPRLVARGLSEVDARARMASQATDAQRRAIADVIVVNRGDLAALAAQVDRLWSTLDKRRSVPPGAPRPVLRPEG